MKPKTIRVKINGSTYRWLSALAKANSNTQLNQHAVTPAELLEKAAFCMADHAGRRDGSWEADVAKSMLFAAGYQGEIPFGKRAQLSTREERDRKAWLAKEAA